MGTDNDVRTEVWRPAYLSDEWFAARAIEGTKRLSGNERQRYERLVAAVGAPAGTFSPRARMFLAWLATSYEPTVAGAIELFETARRAGTAPSACVEALAIVADVGAGDVGDGLGAA